MDVKMADDNNVKESEETKKSFSGIPEAHFVEDVDAFMSLSENSGSVESVLQRLDEQHSKYKFMEENLMLRRRRLRHQIPELEKSLTMITFLKKKKGSPDPIQTQFLLCDQVYAQAKVPPTEHVCLWLGANVMLEYTLDEGETLLVKNVSAAKISLEQVEHDLDFLRDQLTTTEVNMARVYNWDVKKRQAAKSGTS